MAEKCLNIAGLRLTPRTYPPMSPNVFETEPGRFLVDVYGYLSGDSAGQRVLVAGKSEYKIAKIEKSVPTEEGDYDPVLGK